MSRFSNRSSHPLVDEMMKAAAVLLLLVSVVRVNGIDEQLHRREYQLE